jgi:hypothetical protein
MSLLFVNPKYKATDLSNAPVPGAFLTFYATGTSTKQKIYSDAALSIELTNPVKADANGQFVAIYLDDTQPAYKVVAQIPDPLDPTVPGPIAQLGTADPVSRFQPLLVVYPRTLAEIAAGITPTNFATSAGQPLIEGDIRRYGALTSAADNSAAINAALLVSANGGNAAFIPAGTWPYTSTLNATDNCSMYGAGASSVLAPNGCDGIDFPAWAPAAPAVRVFRGFAIIGTSTGAKSGISCTVAPSAAWGINFSNIGIQNFSAAIYANGFRICNWTGIFGVNNYYGVYLLGQNTNNRFTGCSFLRGTVTGTGGAWGLSIQASGGLSPQGQQFMGCYFYDYDIGVNCVFGFETQIDNCDISNCTVTGVSITGVLGGFWLTNSWVETANSAATTGCVVNALGAYNYGDIHINSNHLNCDTGNVGSTGLHIPANAQQWVTANDNEFNGWQYGITAGASNFVAQWNRFTGCVNDITLDSSYSTYNTIGPIIDDGTATNLLAFSAGTTPTSLAFYGQGSFVLTLTGMTAGTTGSIGYVANGHGVTLNSAAITGTSNATTMTGTGLPAFLAPAAASINTMIVEDGSANSLGTFSVGTNAVITFKKDVTGAAFTASGTKGLPGCAFSYPLL